MTVDATLGRRRARRMVLLAIASAALLALVYIVAVHTEWGQRIDDAALDGRTTRVAVQNATSRLLDTISIASLALGSAAIVVIALMRRRPHLALAAGVIIVGSNVTTQLLKKVVLDRPNYGLREDPHEMSNWFPSGHSTVAMALAVALVLVVSENARPWAAFGGLIYATAVGAGTVTAGWHRPSDVIGAYLVVTMWTGITVAVLIWAEGAERVRPSRLAGRVPTLSPFLAGVGIGLLLGALAGVGSTLVAARTEDLDAVELGGAYAASIAAITAEIGGAYAASIAAITAFALVLLLAVLASLRGLSLDPPQHEEMGRAAALAPT
jgi:membrane-associated phospholipid phosphatase